MTWTMDGVERPQAGGLNLREIKPQSAGGACIVIYPPESEEGDEGTGESAKL